VTLNDAFIALGTLAAATSLLYVVAILMAYSVTSIITKRLSQSRQRAQPTIETGQTDLPHTGICRGCGCELNLLLNDQGLCDLCADIAEAEARFWWGRE
jgi:hypothetical protein